MRVFVAAATGAIGHYLVPSLIGAGHQATGTMRSPGGQDAHDAAAR